MEININLIVVANISGATLSTRNLSQIDIIEYISNALECGDSVSVTLIKGNKLDRRILDGIPADEIEWL